MVRVTNPFGVKNSIYASGQHDGIDLVSDGSKDVLAIREGTVIRSQYLPAWGNYVVVSQPDGLKAIYAHLSERSVSVGETVGKGTKVGLMGNTGRSTGAHLHLEIQRDYYDPSSAENIADYLGIANKKGALDKLT